MATAGRKSYPETFALQTGHDKTTKVRGQRAVAEPKLGEHEGASMSTVYDPRKTPSLSLSRGRSMVMSRGHITDSCGAREGPAALQALQSSRCTSRHEETIAFMARYHAHATSYFGGGVTEEVRELFFGRCYFIIKCLFRIFYPLILLPNALCLFSRFDVLFDGFWGFYQSDSMSTMYEK